MAVKWLGVVAGLFVVLLVVALGAYGFLGFYLPRKPLSVGDVVQVRFKACPAVVMAAAYGTDGGEMNYDASKAADTLAFCEMPDIDAKDYGKQSFWIVDTGLNWHAEESVCQALNAELGTIPTVSCSSDADCVNPYPCDPSALLPCGCADGCTLTGGQMLRDCPCGATCEDSGKGYFCKLATVVSFTCADGKCVVSTSSCPPPPPCNVHGQMQTKVDPVTGKKTQVNMCIVNQASVVSISDGKTYYDPKNPCVGCYAGQTCEVTDPTTGAGSCSGLAQVYAAVKVDFIAEGQVTAIDPKRGALVQWSRLQCKNPFALSNETFTKARCPLYFRGCIAWAADANAKMKAALFGTPGTDPVGIPAFADKGLDPKDMWPLTTVVQDYQKLGPKFLQPAGDGSGGAFPVKAVPAFTIPASGLDITDTCG